MRKKIAIIAFISALVLTGCGNVTQAAQIPEATTVATTTAEATTEATTAAEEYKLIGKKAEGSDVLIADLENKTDKEIVSFTVKAETEKDYPENRLEDKDTFDKNEKRTLYYVPKKVSDVSYGDSEKVATLQYSVKIEFADKTEAVLHNFPFDDIDKIAELHLEDGITFIKYTSKTTKEKVDTKAAEEMTATLPETTEAIHELDPDANNNIDASYVEETTYAPVQQQAPAAQTPDTGCGSGFATNPDAGCGSGFATNPDAGCGSGFATNPDAGCGSGFVTNN